MNVLIAFVIGGVIGAVIGLAFYAVVLYWQVRRAERRAIARRVAYYGGRDAMDRPFLDG